MVIKCIGFGHSVKVDDPISDFEWSDSSAVTLFAVLKGQNFLGLLVDSELITMLT